MKNPGKSRLEPTTPSRSENIALYQLSQILNRTLQNRWFIGFIMTTQQERTCSDGSLVNFRRMPFQSTQKSTEDVDNGHLKECRAFDVDLHCNTFKIRFRPVFSQAYGGACRRDRTRKTQLPNADTIDFFFLVREKGGFVRTLRTPLGYVPGYGHSKSGKSKSAVASPYMYQLYAIRGSSPGGEVPGKPGKHRGVRQSF